MNVLHLNTHFKKNHRHAHQEGAHEGPQPENQADEYVELALWFTKEIQREHIGLPIIERGQYKEAR